MAKATPVPTESTRIWSGDRRKVRSSAPLDLFGGTEIPRVWKLLRPSGAVVPAIFNWSDTAVESKHQKRELGIGARYHVRDVWSQETLDARSEALILRQPAHSVRLIEARPF